MINSLYFSPVADSTRLHLVDEGVEDPNIRSVSSKVDLHRLADKNLLILSDALIELEDHYEFIDHGSRRLCVGRFGQLCVSSK